MSKTSINTPLMKVIDSLMSEKRYEIKKVYKKVSNAENLTRSENRKPNTAADTHIINLNVFVTGKLSNLKNSPTKAINKPKQVPRAIWRLFC